MSAQRIRQALRVRLSARWGEPVPMTVENLAVLLDVVATEVALRLSERE